MTRLWPLLLLLATPVQAQDLALVPVVLDACRATRSAADCAGLAAAACRQGGPGGTSTGERCLQAELDLWEEALPRALDRAEAAARDLDAQAGSDIRPSAALAVIALQGAWETYRDTRCGYETLAWWGGSAAGIAVLDCRLRLTAGQIDDLDSLAGGER